MSQEILWDTSFSVAHRGLDEQHKRLFSMCKRASVCASGQLDAEDFHALLNDLAEYSLKHMEYEEAILRKCNFPGLDGHHHEHDGFIAQITDCTMDLMQGTSNNQEVAKIAWSWWRNHVLVSDMKYKNWVQEHLPAEC